METTHPITAHPRIYVACLAAYNNGILHGAWIDVSHDACATQKAIDAMLRASPIAGAEEWAIHDHERFKGVRIAEYEDIQRVAEIAEFLIKHGTPGGALIDHYGGDVAEAREALEDHYHGCHNSLADYVQEITEECTAIPPSLQHYIDWPAMARDAEMSGDLFTIQTGYDEVHVFSAR